MLLRADQTLKKRPSIGPALPRGIGQVRQRALAKCWVTGRRNNKLAAPETQLDAAETRPLWHRTTLVQSNETNRVVGRPNEDDAVHLTW
jgi:hypothetical protein